MIFDVLIVDTRNKGQLDGKLHHEAMIPDPGLTDDGGGNGDDDDDDE